MPELLAICVGLPQEVAWHDTIVRTAVWKHAVEGPRMARRLNIDGDGQADLGGHGGEQRAVFVYQIESYRYWQQVLGRDDFVHGQFGENFTVDGLADDEVCIGDRYRIGGAVFEVTQPRVTCYRVGLRMNEPRMPAMLVSHGRPGFYMRVLTEGLVQAGDAVVKVASGPEAMTVAEINALLYLRGHPRSQLVRALRITALSPGWQASLRELLDRGEGGAGSGNVGLNQIAASPHPAWDGFRSMRIAAKAAETTTVSSLWLAGLDHAPLPAVQPGQSIAVRLRPDSATTAMIRSYSLSAAPDSAQYRISVKRELGGAASAYLHDHVRAGDTIDVAAPRGVFTLAGGDGPVVLASAGIGVTPVLAMLYSLAAEHSAREVWWLHGARNGTEHAFAREARTLLAELPNAHSHICYSQPAPDDRPGESYASSGRLSGELIGQMGIPRHADAYLCGPQAFMAELSAALVALGFQRSRIHTETFGALSAINPGVAQRTAGPPHPPADSPGRGPAVSFARSNLTVHWGDNYADLLELAEACDVPTRWSCRTGVCHTCETPVLSGSLRYSPDPIDAPGDGNALICCAQPQSDLVLDL
jgi:ferredoxin-NADP reductase/MOSC domain-containing protein YiiM/ferredoxin